MHHRSASRTLIRAHRDPAAPHVSLGRWKLPEPSIQSVTQRRARRAGERDHSHRLHLLRDVRRHEGMRPQLGQGGHRRRGHLPDERWSRQLRHRRHLYLRDGAAGRNPRLFICCQQRHADDRAHIGESAVSHRDRPRHSPAAHPEADAEADAPADADPHATTNRRTDGGADCSPDRGGSGCWLTDLRAAGPFRGRRRSGGAVGWPGRKPGAGTGTWRVEQRGRERRINQQLGRDGLVPAPHRRLGNRDRRRPGSLSGPRPAAPQA